MSVSPMNKNILSAALLSFIISFDASATTWGEPTPIPDPIKQGTVCKVSEPMSSGSYIYQWPSKYDQVFWPFTDPAGIWFCPESGFAAFIGDFELTAQERAALVADFAMHDKLGARKTTLRDKLERLQKSYAVRSKGTQTDIHVLRVLAYYYESDLGDYAKATALRRQALESIETALRTQLDEAVRLEYLLVSAFYYREFDEPTRSSASLTALQSALKSSKDEKLRDFVDYLTELSKDVSLIEPGGPLVPKVPE
jgi:hypothetical protein